jgi:hypothetical protein
MKFKCGTKKKKINGRNSKLIETSKSKKFKSKEKLLKLKNKRQKKQPRQQLKKMRMKMTNQSLKKEKISQPKPLRTGQTLLKNQLLSRSMVIQMMNSKQLKSKKR